MGGVEFERTIYINPTTTTIMPGRKTIRFIIIRSGWWAAASRVGLWRWSLDGFVTGPIEDCALDKQNGDKLTDRKVRLETRRITDIIIILWCELQTRCILLFLYTQYTRVDKTQTSKTIRSYNSPTSLSPFHPPHRVCVVLCSVQTSHRLVRSGGLGRSTDSIRSTNLCQSVADQCPNNCRASSFPLFFVFSRRQSLTAEKCVSRVV